MLYSSVHFEIVKSDFKIKITINLINRHEYEIILEMGTQSTISEPYLLNVSDKTKFVLRNKVNFRASKKENNLLIQVILFFFQCTIGRSLENTLVIENIKISRVHCSFEENNGFWFITDLVSILICIYSHLKGIIIFRRVRMVPWLIRRS